MKRLAAAILLAGMWGQALAFDPFTVADIRVDGLTRISAGTVFTYLPIEKGDFVDRAKAAEAIRSLYKTGFFKDVQMSRQGDILVVSVIERPAISKIEIDGKIVSTDLLRECFACDLGRCRGICCVEGNAGGHRGVASGLQCRHGAAWPANQNVVHAPNRHQRGGQFDA